MKTILEKKHLPITCIILLALVLRLLLIAWTLGYGNNGDFTRYEDWARIAHTHGLAATYTGKYSTTVVNNEPPGTLYVMSAAYEFYILEGRIIARLTHTRPGTLIWVNTYLQHITMKLPSLAADLLLGVLSYLIVARIANRKSGLLASSLVLFNPVVWYNSAVWGQMDAVNNMLFLLALYLAFRKRLTLSAVAYALSLYVKVSLLPLLPFYFVYLYFLSGRRMTAVVLSFVAGSFAIILLTFPVSANPASWLLIHMPVLAGGELQNVSIAAFNFWMAVTCLPAVCPRGVTPVITRKALGMTLNMWGYTLFGAFTFPLLILQLKRGKAMLRPQNIILIFSLIAYLTFLVLPKMHDRYLYPFFPLFAIVIALSREKKWLLIFYVLLSAVHLDNLIYSWNPIVFASTTMFYHVFYGPWLRWILSSVITLLGLLLYIVSLRRIITAKTGK